MVKCSVITTVWNVEEWLDKNIQSFLAQTLKDNELILVNDCSPDSSKDIIAKYNDSRIKVVNNLTKVGNDLVVVSKMEITIIETYQW